MLEGGFICCISREEGVLESITCFCSHSLPPVSLVLRIISVTAVTAGSFPAAMQRNVLSGFVSPRGFR